MWSVNKSKSVKTLTLKQSLELQMFRRRPQDFLKEFISKTNT